jgi:hypothetical protein
MASGSLAFATPSSVIAAPAAAAPTLQTADAVRVLGARGNGVADDTAAIQAACARGGDVSLPPGTYLVTGPIAISGRLRIHGAGATIVSSEPSGALFRSSGDLAGLVISDLVLRTSRKDLEKRGEPLVYVDSHNLDGALFENVTFDTGSSFQNAVLLAAEIGTRINNVTIRDCSFIGVSAGIELVHHVDADRRITGVKILHNRFAHAGLKDDATAGFAISLSGPLSRVEVTGNDIRGYPYAGIEIVAPRFGGFEADYVIEANTIVGTGRGIITDTGHAGPAARISRVSIAGNTIVGNRFEQRIQGLADSIIEGNVFDIRHAIASPDHQPDFVSLRDCDRLLVSGNLFRVELPSSEAGRAIVAFYGLKESHVSGNRFESSGMHAVRIGSIDKPSTDNSFAANVFVQRDNGSYSDPVAFRGPGTVRNVLNSSTIFGRHDRAVSSQAAGNIAAGMVMLRVDTGELTASKGEAFAIPASEPRSK